MSTSQKDDVEAASDLLYPLMTESPELRWAFIRKVYSIVTLQLLATIAFAAIVASVRPVADFFDTRLGLIIYCIYIVLVPFTVIILLYIYRSEHPLNFFLLGIFTLTFGFAFGVLGAFISGKIVVEAAIATTLVVISLTAYTFWAAKRGQDFGFLGPCCCSCLVTLCTFSVFQIFFPMGRVSDALYSCLGVIIFSAYIVYDTETLIKRNSYDEYIWASVSIYLDIINLFVRLLSIFQSASRRN